MLTLAYSLITSLKLCICRLLPLLTTVTVTPLLAPTALLIVLLHPRCFLAFTGQRLETAETKQQTLCDTQPDLVLEIVWLRTPACHDELKPTVAGLGLEQYLVGR